MAEIYVILRGEVESFDRVGNVHRADPMDCLYIPKGVPHGVRTVGNTDLELIWFHDAIERNGVSVYLDGPGLFPADEELRLVAFDALQPDWGGAEAKVGGKLRWCVNWVAGSNSPVNHNRDAAMVNDTLAAGVTAILPGNSGVMHSHGFAETHIVMAGSGAVHQGDEVAHMGRLDAARFAPGEKHRILNTGDETLFVFWLHEKPGP